MKSIFKISMLIALIGLGAQTAGAEGELLSQAPLESKLIAQEFQRLATCTFERIYAREPGGLKKADLIPSGIIRISLDTGSVIYWTLTFTRIAPNQTRVDLTAARTLWGPSRIGADKALLDAQACGK